MGRERSEGRETVWVRMGEEVVQCSESRLGRRG